MAADWCRCNVRAVGREDLTTGERRLPDASDVRHTTVANINGSGNGAPHASGGAVIADGGVATPPVIEGAASGGATTVDGGSAPSDPMNTAVARIDGLHGDAHEANHDAETSHGDTLDVSALLWQLANARRDGEIDLVNEHMSEAFAVLQTGDSAGRDGGQH